MNAVFNNQGYQSIKLDTGLDLTALSASNLKILFKKPNGVKGSYVATVIDVTHLIYQFQNGDLDMLGYWEFQTNCTIGGKNAFGGIFRQYIKKNLQT